MAPFCLALTKGCATVNPRISLWLLLILSVWLTACSKTEHQDLSEKPPLSIVPHQTMVNESVIRTRLRIPIDSLQQKLEQDIPEMLYNSPGKVKQKCIRIFGKNHCEEFQVGGWAKRTGPVQLLALNNGYLRVQLPLQYQLSATANGRLIRGLLKEVDFKPASFTAIADLNPSIDSNWHLQVTSRSQIVWRRSPVVKVLGVKIDIQDQIEKPLKKALDKALAKQQLKLASDDRLATRMKDFWVKLQQPRLLTDKFPLWLKATPSALSLSNIQIEKVDHSKIEEFKLEVKIKAIKDAKAKAKALTAALDQEIGKAIYINEGSYNMYQARPQEKRMMIRGMASITMEDAAPQIEFQKIELENKIMVRFELK